MVVRSTDHHPWSAGERELAVLDLNRRVRFTAQLADCFDGLCDAAPVHGVVVAKAAAIGVPRQLAHPRDQISVSDELAALPQFAEAESLELHQHHDGEVVVNGGVVDIGGFDTRFGKGGRARDFRTCPG